MTRSNQDLARELRHGSWIYAFNKENEIDKFDNIGTIYFLDEDFGSFDESMFKLGNFNLYNGRFPKDDTELVIEISKLNDLNLTYDLNQIVKLNDGNTYTLVGIIYDYKAFWSLDIDFPSIITTNKESNDFIYLGKTKSVVALPDGLITTNTLSYPQLDDNSNKMELWTQEDIFLKEQSLRVTYIVLIVSSLIIFVTLFSNYKFYKKRLDIFFGLGISKLNRITYYMAHIFFYMLSIYPLTYASHFILKRFINLLPNLRYDNYLKHLNFSAKTLVLIVLFISVLVFLKDTFEKPNLRFTKLLSYFLIFGVSSLMIITISPKVIELKDEKIPSLKLQREHRENRYYYSLFKISPYDLPDDDNQNFETWSLDELEPIINHNDTKSVYYANHILSQEINDGTNSITIIPDKILNDLEIEYTKDFIKGNTFIILNYIDGEYDTERDQLINGFGLGDSVKFKNESFILENIITYEFEDKVSTFIPSRIIISENGARKLNYTLDTYNQVEINAQKLKSWHEYDAMISRISKDGYLTNHRAGIDTPYMQNYYETLFIVFEILVYISLGIIIDILLFSQLFISQRRSFSIMYFLGKSRRLIIFNEALKLMIISSISLLIALIYEKINGISIDNLIVLCLVSLIAIILKFPVSYILGNVYIKENSLEILEER